MSELGELQISLERIHQDLLQQPTLLPYSGAIKRTRHDDWVPVVALELYGMNLFYITWNGKRISASDVFDIEERT